MLRAHDVRQGIRQIRLQVHHQSALLRQIAPARPGQFDDLPYGAVDLDPLERQLRFALAIELAHARHRPRDIFDGALNRRQILRARSLRLGSRSSSDSV